MTNRSVAKHCLRTAQLKYFSSGMLTQLECCYCSMACTMLFSFRKKLQNPLFCLNEVLFTSPGRPLRLIRKINVALLAKTFCWITDIVTLLLLCDLFWGCLGLGKEGIFGFFRNPSKVLQEKAFFFTRRMNVMNIRKKPIQSSVRCSLSWTQSLGFLPSSYSQFYRAPYGRPVVSTCFMIM